MDEPPPFGDWETVGRLRTTARQNRHRYAVALVGERGWGAHLAARLARGHGLENGRWVAAEPHNPFAIADSLFLSAGHARHLLGDELTYAVVDCHTDFAADALGIVGGAIMAGGVLLMLLPESDDPGDPTGRGTSPYLKRFYRCLARNQIVAIHQQHPRENHRPDDAGPDNHHTPTTTIPTPERITADQARAVAAITKVVTGQRKRPVVLVSDRGRGKSAALGIAARQLIETRALRIGVTARGRRAVESLYRHSGIPNRGGKSALRFFAAHKLLHARQEIDLLLVDEAATLPVSTLSRLLEQYSRVAFATTVHGYEGTGRGFMTRFREILNHRTRGWKQVVLQTPVRWAAGDPVEAFLFDALLLDAEAGEYAPPTALEPNAIAIAEADRARLATDENALRQVFGLLAQAHYRTRPSDLKHFLDNPATRIIIARYAERIVGAMVTNREGGFDGPQARNIWANRIRPRDNLLAELLGARTGVIAAPTLAFQRVVRIVVHPVYQRHGIGSALLDDLSRDTDTDISGANFGAGAAILRFWRENGFTAVFVGATRSHHTGWHTVTCIKPVTHSGQAIARAATERFARNLPLLLPRMLTDLDPTMVPLLWPPAGRTDFDLTPQWQLDDLIGFAFAERSLEDCWASIYELLVHYLATTDPLTETQPDIGLMVEWILQGQTGGAGQHPKRPGGRKADLARCRRAVARILHETAPQALLSRARQLDIRRLKAED